MLTVDGAGPWMCRIPEDEWPGSDRPEMMGLIKKDFQEPWGDRKRHPCATCSRR